MWHPQLSAQPSPAHPAVKLLVQSMCISTLLAEPRTNAHDLIAALLRNALLCHCRAHPGCPVADPWTPDVLVITGIVRELMGSPQEDFKQDSILQQLPESSPFKNLSHALA